MIGGDAGSDVLGGLLAAEAWRVAIDRLTAVVGGHHFGEAARVAVGEAGEVCELAVILEVGLVEGRDDCGSGDYGWRSFDCCGRYAGYWREARRECRLGRALEHVGRARNSPAVAAFVSGVAGG